MKKTVLLAALFLNGCGMITPSQTQINTAYFGDKPSQSVILSLFRDDISKTLIDPYSAVYECGDAKKSWTNQYGKIYFGWAAICSVNAKNKMGGYVGSRNYKILFKDGVIDRYMGDAFTYIE